MPTNAINDTGVKYVYDKLDAKKVDKEAGKGLSTNDFTNEDKALIGQTLGNNTILTTDKTPFLTRQTLNPTGFSGYVREKLVGVSYAWNNRFNNGNFPSASAYGWTASNATITAGVGSIKFTASAQNGYIVNGHNDFATSDTFGTPNHILLISCKVKTASATTGIMFSSWSNPASSGTTTVYTVSSTSWQTLFLFLKTPSAGATNCNIAISDTRSSGWDEVQATDFQITDLTLAFGSTIADYLYGLSNNGGITKLRDMGCPIDKYTPYGYGLYSVKTSGKLIRGFNLFDEEFELGELNAQGQDATSTTKIRSKNYIRLLDNETSYYFKSSSASWLCFYDSGKIFISAQTANADSIVAKPNNAVYCRFNFPTTYGTTYKNDTCINVSTPTGSPKNGDYVPSQVVTYSLGNDELRGKFDLVNGEIVASGDVKKSNGEIDRDWKQIDDLSSLEWTTFGNYKRVQISDIKTSSTSQALTGFIVCEKFIEVISATQDASDLSAISLDTTKYLWISKNATPSGKMVYKVATPTTEQSTPFADPMSLVGATTEEYIDTRDIPCPVGAERQYMGQSEDVVEIPSSPLSDGKRKLVAETSGGKTQYYFEDDKNGAGTQVNLMTYNTSTNKYVCPSDGYISLSNAGASVGDYIIMSVYGANNNTICGLRCDTPVASMVTTQSLFVKRGMKCYVRATSSTGSFTALFTPLA